MPNEKYHVWRYSIERLKEILSQFPSSLSTVEAKLHVVYFEEYFEKLNALTIVVEDEYIDRDYLEDYAGYYVRCFERYERWCRRLHFFSAEFDSLHFDSLVMGKPAAELTPQILSDSYLGFIVVKPLPKTTIGRTCLKTYPSGSRAYPILKTVEAHLFGHKLTVRSLPFQEQDQEVAACATSALWSAFHGTGELFHHSIPTPVEITKRATDGEPSESRHLPAGDGLDPKKMARAIRSVGLEPLYVSARNEQVLKTTIYAYVTCGIPVVLGFVLVDNSSQAPLRPRGKHAVAVTGYNLQPAAPVPDPETGTLFRAAQVDKLYVHDDQVGPFARMEFDGKLAVYNVGQQVKQESWSLGTSWRNKDEELGCRAVPTMMLLPLYNKIRLPYVYAESVIRTFDSMLHVVSQGLNDFPRPIWDIHLATGAAVKEDVLRAGILSGPYLREFLTKAFPRFVWRATALQGERPAMDIFLDATGIEQGDPCSGILEYDAKMSAAARGVAANPAVIDDVRDRPAAHLMARLSALPQPDHLVP